MASFSHTDINQYSVLMAFSKNKQWGMSRMDFVYGKEFSNIDLEGSRLAALNEVIRELRGFSLIERIKEHSFERWRITNKGTRFLELLKIPASSG